MSRQYEILLMDADGTLLDFDRAEAESFKEVLRKFGFPLEEELVAEYHKINRECWEAFEEGKMERNTVLTRRFELFFENHGMSVDGQEVEDFYRDFLGKGYYLLEGALDILDYLKEKYVLYIVTNGVADTQRIRLKDSGLVPYFQDVFISEDAGSQKPQKEFFEYCFKHMPCADPDKMLLIGDSLTSDIKGGINAGVDTCWYNPAGTENNKGIIPDYEISDLKELKRFL